MKKLKLASLIKASNAIHALSEQDKAKSYSFGITVRFRLADMQARLKTLLEKIQLERNKLIEAHGEKNEKGQMEVKRTSDKWSAFEAEHKAIEEAEFEVEVKTITLEELANARTVKSRDEKGQVSENQVENQVSVDVMADLIETGILAAGE